MGELNGLKALVTGGASGIGLAVATTFAAEGAAVVVLDLAAERPKALPDEIGYIPADVTDDAAVRAAVGAAVESLNGLDILVNNAGIGAQGTVEDASDDDWHRVLDVNVVGTARVSRAAWPALRASGHAAVVNTCSIAATAGLPQRAVYSASKGAVAALTRAMAADGMPDGIRVNAVNPGTADTPWVGRLLDSAPDPAAERAALEARQPHGRLVSAEEIAHAVAVPGIPPRGVDDRRGDRGRRRHGRPAAAPAHVSVIDAHVHLWDLAARPQPWTAQFPVLQRDFLLPELEKVLDDHGVDAAVVVQAGDTAGETLDLLALAGTTPRLAGVVGWVNLDGPDVRGAVAALRAAPGGGKLVAVRHQLQVEPDPRYLARPGVRDGLAVVARGRARLRRGGLAVAAAARRRDGRRPA